MDEVFAPYGFLVSGNIPFLLYRLDIPTKNHRLAATAQLFAFVEKSVV